MSKKKAERSQSQALTVTVLVSPLARFDKKNLQRELGLVRSALLYADRVRLVSPTSALLSSLTPLRGVDSTNPWRDVRNLPDATLERIFGKGSVKSVRKDFAKLLQLPGHDPRRTKIEATFLPPIKQALDSAASFYDQALTPEIDLAIDSKVLELETTAFDPEASAADQANWFRDRLKEHWQDPTSTMLFDPRAQRMSAKIVQHNRPWAATEDRTKRAAIGSGLVRQLPTFPNAEMEDVLEVRRDLSAARSSYRTAIRGIAPQLASKALDAPLDSEIEEYWLDVIEPAMAQLTAGVLASRIARGTAKRLVGALAAGMKTGGITVGVASIAGFGDLLTAAVTGAVTGSLYATGTVIQEASAQHGRAPAPELVYLNNIHKRLPSVQ